MSTVANAPLVIDNIRPAPGGLTPGQLPSARPSTSDEDLSFWDLLDVVNPLQHLPIISTIYREITGDTIKPASRVIGGALFGGPVGAAAAVVTQAVEEGLGLEEGETLLALFDSDETPAPAEPQSPTQLIAGYAAETAPAAAASATTTATAPASTAPASAAPLALAEAPAASGAAAATAGTDARMHPAAAPAGFMPIRSADYRPADVVTRMPVPEKRPAGLPPRTHDPRALAMATPARPASAAPLEFGESDGYIRVPSKAQMAAADAAAPVSTVIDQQTADAAVLRSLEAQGLQAEARKHPMLRPVASAPASAAAVSEPVTGAAGYATAADSVAAAEAGPQQMPGWFDQAMMKALDRYQQTGSLSQRPAPTVAAGA